MVHKLHPDRKHKWGAKELRRTCMFVARGGGRPLKDTLRLAIKKLDERNLWTLVRSLARQNGNKKTHDGDVNALICLLDDQGALTGRPGRDSALISSHLHGYKLSPGAYAKRIQRLLKIGVRLNSREKSDKK